MRDKIYNEIIIMLTRKPNITKKDRLIIKSFIKELYEELKSNNDK